MSKPRRPSPPRPSVAMMGDVYTGEAPLPQACPTLNSALGQAHIHARDNHFVATVIRLWLAFYDHGFKLKAVRPEDQPALDAFATENRKFLSAYRRSVWRSWLITRNIVSFWITGSEPLVIRPDRCEFSNAFGRPKLAIRPSGKASDLRGVGFKQAEQSRYSGRFQVSPDWGEDFRVTTDTEEGDGFAWPALHSVDLALKQHASMEAGENGLAHLGRMPTRQHKIGYEITSGPRAGQPLNHWSKKRSDDIEKFFKGKAGPTEFTSNFDHEMIYGWVDPKLYDAEKWRTIIVRLQYWAGPLGLLLAGTAATASLAPQLLGIFKVQAADERRVVADHLIETLRACFGLPPFEVCWSSNLFTDARTFLDSVKYLQQAGGLSLQTATEEHGYDRTQEIARKLEEAKLPREAVTPPFDPAHGETPGRPPGTPDPT